MSESFSNFARTALDGGISDTDLTIDVVYGDAFPLTDFYVVIGDGPGTKEIIFVESRTGNVLTISALNKRGLFGTSAAAHLDGVKVVHTILSHHINTSQAAAKIYLANNFI